MSKICTFQIPTKLIQGKVAYMHQQGGIDNLYEFVIGNGWDKITKPTDNGRGGRECFITTIDGSVLHFDEPQ